MRAILALPSLCLCGCLGMLTGTGGAPAPGDPGAPDPEAAWSLSIDTSRSDTYLPVGATTATIRGHVVASAGVDRAEIGPGAAPTRVPVDSGGSFTAPATVAPGYSLVEARAYDRQGRVVNGHRSVLSAAYTPEWQLLGETAVLAADEAMLAALGESAGALLGGLDLGSFITPGTALMNNSTCQLFVNRASTGRPSLRLAPTADGRLLAVVRVPDITVGFGGRCNALGTEITVRDSSEADETTVELSMILEPIEPAPGQCIQGFTASDVNLRITSFDLDLRLSGSLLLSLAGEVVGEIIEGPVKSMIQRQLMEQVGPLVGPMLAELRVLDETTTLDFLGTSVELGLCLTGLGPSPEGQLLARLGTRARGPGGLGIEAPGAPHLPTTPPATGGGLLLDPALVSQILFSVWNGGAFAIPDVSALGGGGEGLGFTIDTLSGIVPPLRQMLADGRIPRGAPLVVGVDAQMAPLVRAATPEESATGADVFIELGDLRLSLGTSAGTLFELASHVRLGLSLEATPEGALAPVLVAAASSSRTWIVDTAVTGLAPRNADTLAELVDGLIVSQLSPLLSGVAIALPDLGVPLHVGDVAADPGGYLVIDLTVGAP
ncbi:MAG: hypothetical protein KF729_27415 [Sandaracinaceae bacterium]|nr:hypothetical protein [Sandaracinaceae bacterium]